jgi:hypothetical protein
METDIETKLLKCEMEKVKNIYDNLQEDIQIKIMEEYIVPQLIEDELINKFDELIDSEECKRLNWQVLTDVVGKIIENECALSKMCKKDVLGFKDIYEQHFIRKVNTFKDPSWTPLSSMCAEFVMRKWH